VRCIIERIKLNIIPKNSSTHCHEHPREWRSDFVISSAALSTNKRSYRVLVPLVSILVRENYSFGEYLWDEELELVEVSWQHIMFSRLLTNNFTDAVDKADSIYDSNQSSLGLQCLPHSLLWSSRPILRRKHRSSCKEELFSWFGGRSKTLVFLRVLELWRFQ